MMPTAFRFENFELDPADRRLLRDGVPIELSARYLDALALLVGEAGRLVPKDRFMDEVWRGVPVTDEALTQCIKSLRKQLGDAAGSPRFIETVPKHGYRFIAPVTGAPRTVPSANGSSDRWKPILLAASAGTIGAGIAGFVGGTFYGLATASQPLAGGPGALSMLLVILWLTMAAALMGGAALSLGIAAAQGLTRDPRWAIVGGGLGGVIVGAFAKLLGVDAFNLLLGRAPLGITGGLEGLALGGAVGAGAWLADRPERSIRRGVALAGLAGLLGGALINLLGGRLMGGSLDLLQASFPETQLRLGGIGRLFGESMFGPISRTVTGALEGGLFAACIVGTMMFAQRGRPRA